jgi:hypothetical protein
MNASGQVAFFSVLVGTGVMTGVNDRALWVTTPSGIEQIARKGEAAPGTGAGVNFNLLEAVPPAINALGQVAFTATLTGTGVVGTNDRGLWAGTPDNVSLVAREGDVIDVDPGPDVLNRTISSISFASDYNRHPVNPSFESASAAFNDAGQIAWRAAFVGGETAIFLTQLPGGVAPSLDGDYNDDGFVDTADFVVWQKFNGTSADLPNDPNPVPIDNDQYTTWQTHFGESNAGAGGADRSTTVPEPSHWWLLYVVTAFGGSGSNGRRKRQ